MSIWNFFICVLLQSFGFGFHFYVYFRVWHHGRKEPGLPSASTSVLNHGHDRKPEGEPSFIINDLLSSTMYFLWWGVLIRGEYMSKKIWNYLGWVGLGLTVAQRCIAPLLRIVPWPPTFARSSKALRSSRVIPANNPFHSCKYSTGTSRTIWYGCYYYCQFKEGIQTYNIRLVCTVITYIQYL